jgi:hypothetical protein
MKTTAESARSRNHLSVMDARVTIYPLAALLILSQSLVGQTLVVRMLNGESGKPFGPCNVTISWGVGLKPSRISVGADGFGRFDTPHNASEFMMLTGPRNGPEPFRLAYLNCNKQGPTHIQVAQVVQKGFVPLNVCGPHMIVPRPGEVVFWAQPLPAGKPDFQ